MIWDSPELSPQRNNTGNGFVSSPNGKPTNSLTQLHKQLFLCLFHPTSIPNQTCSSVFPHSCCVRHRPQYRSTLWTINIVPYCTRYYRSHFDTILPQPHTQLDVKERKIPPHNPFLTELTTYLLNKHKTNQLRNFCCHPTHPTHCYFPHNNTHQR